MNVIECEQGTAEWRQARCGLVTGSRVADVMAKVKSGEAAARRNYRAQLVAERLCGRPLDSGFVSPAMQRGTELEPFARGAYEVARGVLVDQRGFVAHPILPMCGASPDGAVGDEGLIEIKVPLIATHIGYLLAGEPPAEYHFQMLMEMACCERAWVDFVSYCPDLPQELQLFVVRFECDPKRIAEMEDEVMKFNAEVDHVIAQLRKLTEIA